MPFETKFRKTLILGVHFLQLTKVLSDLDLQSLSTVLLILFLALIIVYNIFGFLHSGPQDSRSYWEIGFLGAIILMNLLSQLYHFLRPLSLWVSGHLFEISKSFDYIADDFKLEKPAKIILPLLFSSQIFITLLIVFIYETIISIPVDTMDACEILHSLKTPLEEDSPEKMENIKSIFKNMYEEKPQEKDNYRNALNKQTPIEPSSESGNINTLGKASSKAVGDSREHENELHKVALKESKSGDSNQRQVNLAKSTNDSKGNKLSSLSERGF